MELPGEQFVRDLRAEIGAVHMLTCGLAFAASDKVDMQSDASPDKQREMITVPMRFTTTVDGQVRTVLFWPRASKMCKMAKNVPLFACPPSVLPG